MHVSSHLPFICVLMPCLNIYSGATVDPTALPLYGSLEVQTPYSPTFPPTNTQTLYIQGKSAEEDLTGVIAGSVVGVIAVITLVAWVRTYILAYKYMYI